MGRSTNKRFKHNLSDAEIRSIFTDEMKRQGLIFDGTDLPIHMDGRTRYVRVSNRSRLKKNHRSGWYVGHMGDFPCGKFGWLHGDQPVFKWSLYNHLKSQNGGVDYVELTEEEMIERSKQEEREERRRKREEKERFEFAKALSIIEWVRSLDLKNHPYLISKRFSLEECRPYVRIYNPNNYTTKELEKILNEHFPEYNKPSNIRKLINYQVEHITYRGFNLIMQGKLIDGTPQMLQLIFDKKSRSGKNKHFPKLLNKQNTFLTLGSELTAETKNVIICEGWGTGMSILRFTGGEVPILVAWDSGNMNSVAKVVRKNFPNCEIYSANDNDHTKPIEKNAGIHGGLKTCYAVGARMVLPPFDSTDPTQEELSDWNDIDLTNPPPVSSKLFYDAFMNAKYIEAEYSPEVPLLTEETFFDPDEMFDKLDYSNEFQQTWVALMRLVLRGIQHCEYTAEEQMEMYQTELVKVKELFEASKLTEIKRIYDTNIDLQLSEIFFTFTNQLHFSENSIMADSKLFSPILKEIRAKQSLLPNESLLITLRDIVAEKYGSKLATACMLMYLKQANYFLRSQEEWQLALLNRLKSEKPDLNLSVLIPLLVKQTEVDYWEHPTKIQRELSAVASIMEEVKQMESSNSIQSIAEVTSNQITKLKHIYSAQHKLLIEDSEKNRDYLKRLISRFNETENTTLEDFDLIQN